MGYAKIVFNGQTKIDLTGDTVVAEKLPVGIKAHDRDGNQIIGTMQTQGYRYGNQKPDDSLGDENDLFFVMEG